MRIRPHLVIDLQIGCELSLLGLIILLKIFDAEVTINGGSFYAA